MEINKNIILDLLPIYLSNEASSETKELVEKYLAENKDIARIVQIQRESLNISSKIQVPLSRDHQITAYKKSRIQIALTIVFAAMVLLALLGTLVFMFITPA